MKKVINYLLELLVFGVGLFLFLFGKIILIILGALLLNKIFG